MAKNTKRVVAYARVSTGSEDQRNSFENQKSYFMRELERHEGYELVCLPTNTGGIYADRGVSGIKLVRPEFNQMLEDAGLHRIVSEATGKVTDKYEIYRKPKFDIIFVKDTSRFARNTTADDLLKTLRANNVVVHFLDIQRTTEDLNDLTAIQIFLSLSESESSRKSKSVKFGYQEGARKGNIYMGGKIFGYDYIKKDPKKPYTTNLLRINEAEAKVIRRVFDMYTEEGLGHQQICKKLAEEGYFNGNGKQYTRSTVSRWLENEKYMGVNTAGRYTYGDLFHRKQQEIEYDNEVRVKAREETQRLADEGIVTRIEPIISREQFEKAQEIRKQNQKAYNNNCTYHGITDYARKIKCGCCGAWYISASRRYYEDQKKMLRYYACAHRVSYDEKNGVKKCINPSIREDKLDAMLNGKEYYEMRFNSLEEILAAGDNCIVSLKKSIDINKDELVKEADERIRKLETEKNKLIPLYAQGIYDLDTLEKMTREYSEKISAEKARRDLLAKSNEEIRTLIARNEELIACATEEMQTLQEAFRTGVFPHRSRKEQLRDIECIHIDIYGNPVFIFKSILEFEKTIDILDNIAKTYEKATFEA